MFWFQPWSPFSDERERLGDLRGSADMFTCLSRVPLSTSALWFSCSACEKYDMKSIVFFCPKSGFLHEWLFGEKASRFAHVSLSNSDTSTVCHCKHGSGYVFALLWKELWWWWVHLNYEDASMLIADLAEPFAQCFRAAQLLWKKVIWSNYLQNLQQ